MNVLIHLITLDFQKRKLSLKSNTAEPGCLTSGICRDQPMFMSSSNH